MMLKEHYDHKQPLNPHLAVSALCHLIEAEDSAVERRNAGRGETIGALRNNLWVAWNQSEAKTHIFTQTYHCRANKGGLRTVLALAGIPQRLMLHMGYQAERRH